MKHYTLPEHRTFCIESGIPNGEVWKQVVKLGWMPEGIYHAPDAAFDPKQKEKQKEYQKKRQSTPEYKAWRKAYRDRPEYKAKQKKYNSTPEVKAKRKEYYRRNKK